MSSIARQAPALRPGESGFTLLRLDRMKLIIPRDDVRVVELAIDLERDQPPPHGVGWIQFEQQRCPVYCPSMELEWMDELIDARAICAVLSTKGQTFGLLCSEATLLRSDGISLHDLPPAMAAADSPVDQLAIHEGTVACLSSAARILADLPAASAREEQTMGELS